MTASVGGESTLHSGFRFEDWLRQGGDRQTKRFVLNAAYQRIGWVYAAVNVTARTLAGTPVQFLREDETGDPEVITDPADPVNLLFNPPAPPSIPSLRELISRTYIHMGIEGGVFWVFSKEDPTLEQFDTVRTKKLGQLRPVHDDDGRLLGWVEVDKRTQQAVAAFKVDEVLPLFLYNPNAEDAPLSPLSAARLSLESEFQMNAWNAAFFKQGLRNPLAIKLRQKLTPTQEKEFDKKIKKFYGGIDQAQAAIILHGGAEPVDLGMPTKDIEFIEGKKINREEILGVYGVPPAMVGIFEFANYANSREQQKIFWQNTIIPIQEMLKDIINLNLLEPNFPGTKMMFDLSGVEVLQPDPTEIANSAKIYFEIGYNRLEVANILSFPKLAEDIQMMDEDEPPADDEEPIEEPTDDDEPEAPEDLTVLTPIRLEFKVSQKALGDEAWWLAYGRAHKSMILREEEKMTKAIKRFLDTAGKALIRKAERGEPLVLGETLWAQIWEGAVNLHIQRTMTLAGQVTVLELLRPTKTMPSAVRAKAVDLANYMTDQQLLAFQDAIQEFVGKITNVGQDVINGLNASLTEQLTSGQSIAQIRGSILDVVEETFSSRATTIARTTSNAAYNSAREVMFTIHGVTEHQWVNAGDDVVRDSHQQEGGNIAKIGEQFPVTGLRRPLDPSGPPEEVINCRCTTVAVTKRTPGQPLRLNPDRITPAANLGGFTTATLQAQLTDALDTLSDGAKPFKTAGKAPRVSGLEMLEYPEKRVFPKRKTWESISSAMDTVEDRAPDQVIGAIKDSARPGGTAMTAAGKRALARHLQRPLPASLREGLEPVALRFSDEAEELGQAFYSPGVKRITMPTADGRALVRFMNDPLQYVEDGHSLNQALRALVIVSHEYGHHMQRTLPTLQAWAREQFKARTLGTGNAVLKDVNPLDKRAGKALEDKFHSRYQGRVYDFEIDANDATNSAAFGGEEIIPMYYERVAILPWDKAFLDFVELNEKMHGSYGKMLSESFLVDPDGLRDFMKLLHGDF